MMKTVLFALALSVPAALAAQSGPTAADAVQAPVPNDPGGRALMQPLTTASAAGAKAPDKVMCRAVDTLGSRLGGRRECHTRAEWVEINRRAADDLDKRIRAPHQEGAGG